MITLLINSDITQKTGNDVLTIHSLCDSEVNCFQKDGNKIKLGQFILKINRNEQKEIINLHLELKNLSPNQIIEICRSFNQSYYSEEFLKSNKMFLRLTLNERQTERLKFFSINKPEDIFNIESNTGEKIILNLNNYTLRSFRLIEF